MYTLTNDDVTHDTNDDMTCDYMNDMTIRDAMRVYLSLCDALQYNVALHVMSIDANTCDDVRDTINDVVDDICIMSIRDDVTCQIIDCFDGRTRTRTIEYVSFRIIVRKCDVTIA